MVDVHCHLIPTIDDGSNSIIESVEMFKEAKEAGFTDIIVTPHYMEDIYETKPSIIEFWIEQLRNIIVKEKLDLELYAGNEVYITENIHPLIKNRDILRLANSSYLLMELPLIYNVQYVDNTVFTLSQLKITPIIAHPERYIYVQDNLDYITHLKDLGCLIQCNYGSVVGMYGREAEKTIKKLLKANLVDYLGTDTHKPGTVYAQMNRIMTELRKEISEEQIKIITETNPKKIIIDGQRL